MFTRSAIFCLILLCLAHRIIKDQNLIQQINDYELQMLQTPIIAGKDKGKPIISVIKLEQHYKGFKATLAKNLKLKRKMQSKAMYT